MLNEITGWRRTFERLENSGCQLNSTGSLLMIYPQSVQSAVLYRPGTSAHPLHVQELRPSFRPDVLEALRPFVSHSGTRRNSSGWDAYDIRDWSAFETAIAAMVPSSSTGPTADGDWSSTEVELAIRAYFEMLSLEATHQPYNKSSRNELLRQELSGRSKGSVERKHQNISAALMDLDLPFISGYKPLGNAQTLLRERVEAFVTENVTIVEQILSGLNRVPVDLGGVRNVLVSAPLMIEVARKPGRRRKRLPRKIDFALLEDQNRALGRSGEEWVLQFERQRLLDAGVDALSKRIEWISDQLGDGSGYDILSFETNSAARYIEVKTTNGPITSPFFVSRNEMDVSAELGDAFYLYRVFNFYSSPKLFLLQGDLRKHLHFEPVSFLASFVKPIQPL